MKHEIEYDEAKNARNILERGLSFERAAEFDLENATVTATERNGERRSVAYGYLDHRLHVLCTTARGSKIRAISFRKANELEVAFHGLPLRSDG